MKYKNFVSIFEYHPNINVTHRYYVKMAFKHATKIVLIHTSHCNNVSSSKERQQLHGQYELEEFSTQHEISPQNCVTLILCSLNVPSCEDSDFTAGHYHTRLA